MTHKSLSYATGIRDAFEYLMAHHKEVFAIEYEIKKSISERLSMSMKGAVEHVLSNLVHNSQRLFK